MSALTRTRLMVFLFLMATNAVALTLGVLVGKSFSDPDLGQSIGLIVAIAVLGTGVLCIVYRRKADKQVEQIREIYKITTI